MLDSHGYRRCLSAISVFIAATWWLCTLCQLRELDTLLSSVCFQWDPVTQSAHLYSGAMNTTHFIPKRPRIPPLWQSGIRLVRQDLRNPQYISRVKGQPLVLHNFLVHPLSQIVCGIGETMVLLHQRRLCPAYIHSRTRQKYSNSGGN